MLTYFDETIPEMESIRFLNRHLKLISALKIKTHFDLEEIQNLLVIHHKLTKQGGPLNYRKFREVAHRVFDIAGAELYDKIYSWCDPHRAMHVSLENWVLALSVLLRGSLQEKIDFCWKVYDLYGTGYITRELMFQYMKSSIIKASAGEDSNEVVKVFKEIPTLKLWLNNYNLKNFFFQIFKNICVIEGESKFYCENSENFKFRYTMRFHSGVNIKNMNNNNINGDQWGATSSARNKGYRIRTNLNSGSYSFLQLIQCSHVISSTLQPTPLSCATEASMPLKCLIRQVAECRWFEWQNRKKYKYKIMRKNVKTKNQI